jgi:hypothetical protein
MHGTRTKKQRKNPVEYQEHQSGHAFGGWMMLRRQNTH